MRVHIGRRAQVGVPEQFLYELQVACFLVNNRSGGVPEGVEAGSPAAASNSEAIECRIENIAPQNIRVQRRTVLFAEDEVLGTVLI